MKSTQILQGTIDAQTSKRQSYSTIYQTKIVWRKRKKKSQFIVATDKDNPISESMI